MRGRPLIPALSARRAALIAALLQAWALPGAAEPQVLAVDLQASRVRIHLGRSGLLKFLGHEHTIEAPLAEGSIEVDAEDFTRSRVRLRWEARRLAVVPGTEPQNDVPDVEKRMRGPEVLDVERHPEIAFSSLAVSGAATAAGQYRLRVRGTLELLGRAHEIELPLEVRREGEGLDATGEVELELRALGIRPPVVAGVVKVANRFRVAFDIRATTKQAGAE